MGYKSIVIINNDHLDIIRSNPELFVKNLLRKLSTHKREGGSVSCNDGRACASVAEVVYSGHVDESPTFKFEDFSAIKL